MFKGQSFQQMVLENRISTCKRIKLNPYLTSYTKINSKWIKNLKVRTKSVKPLEEHMGGNLQLHDIGFSNDFLNMTSKAQATTTINKFKALFIPSLI